MATHLVCLCAMVLAFWAPGGTTYEEKYTIDHVYYTMSLYQDNSEGMYDKHHVDMSEGNSFVHTFLSEQAQGAEKVEPGFIFPFYGHLVHNFYVTTHGFISFAPRIHNLMYKTQYIAPLRVKLDPSRYNESTLNYKLHGPFDNSLTVQWTNVSVAEPFEHPMGGKFTFQVTLHADGTIVFVYVFVPDLLTTDALYDNEPVAGLSDAFLIGDSELHVYHTLNVDNPDIRTGTVIVFNAKPTCIRQTSCDACMNLRETSEFGCSYCPAVHRCSDGADRLREHWDQNRCGEPEMNVTSLDQCSTIQESDHTEWRNSMVNKDPTPETDGDAASSASGGNAAAIVSAVISTILVLILLGLCSAYLYVYGRRNPGGWAEQISQRLEAPYKRFGILDESNNQGGNENNNNNQVEMGAKFSENNNTETAISF